MVRSDDDDVFKSLDPPSLKPHHFPPFHCEAIAREGEVDEQETNGRSRPPNDTARTSEDNGDSHSRANRAIYVLAKLRVFLFVCFFVYTDKLRKVTRGRYFIKINHTSPTIDARHRSSGARACTQRHTHVPLAHTVAFRIKKKKKKPVFD